MAIGERIHFFRLLRGMTQKYLGTAVGFPERSADVRLAQYETGSRKPKADLTAALAQVLDVSPQALDVPDIDSYIGLMHTLFTLEDVYGLTVSEALACNLPMAIFDAIPGPETENAEFLIDNNMAVKIQKGSACSETIYDLLSNQERLEEMRRSCSAFDKSSSGPKIVNEIQKLVKD